MGYYSSVALVIPGVNTTAYTDADAFGTNIAIDDMPARGQIQSIRISDLPDAVQNIDVIFSRASITSTNNVALDLTDALANDSVIGVVLVDTWATFADNAIGTETNIGLPYNVKGSLNIQLVTRGAITLATGDAPTIVLGIEY